MIDPRSDTMRRRRRGGVLLRHPQEQQKERTIRFVSEAAKTNGRKFKSTTLLTYASEQLRSLFFRRSVRMQLQQSCSQ